MCLLGWSWLGVGSLGSAAAAAAVDALPQADAPYPQEITRRLESTPSAGLGFQGVEVGDNGEARAWNASGWFRPEGAHWKAVAEWRVDAPGAWVFPSTRGTAVRLPVAGAEVVQVLRAGATTWVASRREVWQETGGNLRPSGWAGASRGEVRQIFVGANQDLWVAAANGVFRRANEAWESVVIRDGHGRQWGVSDVRGVAGTPDGKIWVAMPAGVAVREGETWRFYEGRDGLPYNDFTGVTAATDGAIWFGTRRGAIRFDGHTWAYRQGRRWLPGDEVFGMASGPGGTMWFATSQGAGAIERRPMTLADKAALYEEEVAKYIKRTEFGYTSEVGLGAPGDRSKISLSDSDNDGLWTAMYGAGECFGFAATKRPEFQDRAKQAFEALRFLQKVTQGGDHAPPKGFVARSIRPVEWPDPNVGRLEADKRDRENGDRMWKVYEPRWPKSADGRWYWKSDTSSDELDGHYFFYARYFDLVADAAEKARVREVVADLTDHLMDHGFCLVDHDGTPTRWGVFGPGYLNADPRWSMERGLNSLSILSYLSVAHHVTGDEKYSKALRELVDRHGYGANVLNPKAQTGPGSGNQSDDEMAIMCFYNLLQYADVPEWKERWLFTFHAYAALELPEMNPFFNFAYAARGLGGKFSNAWGDFPMDPWSGWLTDSLSTLREFSLDRANWAHQNSHRLDLQPLPSQQAVDVYEPRNHGRGYRLNGKVISVAERHFNHWNTDPWRLDYGGDGRELASGTVFLLPYYMGLYHGYIR